MYNNGNSVTIFLSFVLARMESLFFGTRSRVCLCKIECWAHGNFPWTWKQSRNAPIELWSVAKDWRRHAFCVNYILFFYPNNNKNMNNLSNLYIWNTSKRCRIVKIEKEVKSNQTVISSRLDLRLIFTSLLVADDDGAVMVAGVDDDSACWSFLRFLNTSTRVSLPVCSWKLFLDI